MAGGVRSSWEEWEGAMSRVVSLGLDTRLLHPDYQETDGGPASAR